MKNWNVIVSVFQSGFRRAVRALRALGPVERSPYHNVLLMSATDPVALLQAIEQRTDASPARYDAISRVAPAMRSFEFRATDEFLDAAGRQLIEWAPRLYGGTFHVRLHRRGLRHALRSPDVERRLDDVVLEGLRKAGMPGRLSFADPDAVIAIDTIDQRAGLGLWTRDDLTRHRLLRPD